MKTLFTVHAGEYLVGSHIGKTYPKWRVWMPAKDTGIDLLVTDPKNKAAVSLQVKSSKDYNPTSHRGFLLQNKLRAMGWWTHQVQKIQKSQADFWVFVLPSFMEHETSFIIIPPAELLRRFRAVFGNTEKRIDSYLWVTKTGHCWEARGLTNAEQEKLAWDSLSDRSREFTKYLNAWDQIAERL